MPLSTTTTTGKSPVTSAAVGSAGNGFAANMRGRMVRMSGIGAIERTPTTRESASTSSTVRHSASYVKLEGEYPRVLKAISRRLQAASKSATSFGWSRSAPKLNRPTRVTKPFFPRGLLRSTSAA